MQTVTRNRRNAAAQSLRRNRRIAEFWRIFQDPVLLIGLVLVVLFIIITIISPIYAMVEESLTEKGRELFDRYLTSPVYQRIIRNTMEMGLLVGATGTVLGFIMAYAQVKVAMPFKRVIHIMALVPIISPPFAVATAARLVDFAPCCRRNGTRSPAVTSMAVGTSVASATA